MEDSFKFAIRPFCAYKIQLTFTPDFVQGCFGLEYGIGILALLKSPFRGRGHMLSTFRTLAHGKVFGGQGDPLLTSGYWTED